MIMVAIETSILSNDHVSIADGKNRCSPASAKRVMMGHVLMASSLNSDSSHVALASRPFKAAWAFAWPNQVLTQSFDWNVLSTALLESPPDEIHSNLIAPFIWAQLHSSLVLSQSSSARIA